MKNENYNVIINTLDDRVMYKEISRRLSEMDRSRFRSMWLVPLVSGVFILLLWILHIPALINIVVSLFGAVITYFIFRWAKQNFQMTRAFRKHAALLESRKNQQENLPADQLNEGPYSIIESLSEKTITLPHMSHSPDGNEPPGPPAAYAWSKEKAESAVYMATILLWLLTILLGVVKIYFPAFALITGIFSLH